MNVSTLCCLICALAATPVLAVAQATPRPTAVDFKRATEQLNTGKPSLALPTFEAAVRAEPNNTEALYKLGLAQAQSGSLPAAIGTLQQTVRLSEQSGQKAPLAHNALGWSYFLDGRPALAKQSLQRGLDSVGNDKEAQAKLLNNLGMVHMALGEYEMSAASFERATAISGSDFSRRNSELAARLKATSRPQPK